MGGVGPSQRGTIFLEDAAVIDQQAFADGQFVMRLHAPQCASRAQAGSFAHVTCDPAVPMRRPLSIMRANPAEGWIEFLYKVIGDGLRHLSSRRPGDRISVLGPIGMPFRPAAAYPRPLLIGGGVGIPPMVFLAESLRSQLPDHDPLVIMGSEIPFPFAEARSGITVPGIPSDVDACMPLLEEWGITSRLTSLQGYAGCFKGYVTDLARSWLAQLQAAERRQVQVFACGPTPMLEAVAALAREFELPCQVSLEEFMACAVGGCAGCTVLVRTPQGPAMKRVCVDGPVFEASEVFPAPDQAGLHAKVDLGLEVGA